MTTENDSTRSPTATERPRLPNDATAVPTETLRDDSLEPIVSFGDEPTESPEARSLGVVGVVDSVTRADELDFAAVDGVERVRSFVEATSFEESSVVVTQDRIQRCRRLELCEITWKESQVRVKRAAVVRDDAGECGERENTTVAQFHRVPSVIHDPLEQTSLRTWYSSCASGTTRSGTATDDGA